MDFNPTPIPTPWWKAHLSVVTDHDLMGGFLKDVLDKPNAVSGCIYEFKRATFPSIYFQHYVIHTFDDFHHIVRIDFSFKLFQNNSRGTEKNFFIAPDLSAIVDVVHEPNTGEPTVQRFEFIDPRTGREISIRPKGESNTKAKSMMDQIRETVYLLSWSGNKSDFVPDEIN